MELHNSFDVPVERSEVWDLMLDVERVAPCLPGAELAEVVDEDTWKGTVVVALGPIKLSYKGKVKVEERDQDGGRVVLKATGQETRGKGMASATVTSRLTAIDGGTKVDITTDLTLAGPAAQSARGMLGDVSQRLTDEFATCLASQFEAAGPKAAATATGSGPAGSPSQASAATARAAAAPKRGQLSGIRLALWALWRAIVRTFKRLFGGARSSDAR